MLCVNFLQELNYKKECGLHELKIEHNLHYIHEGTDDEIFIIGSITKYKRITMKMMTKWLLVS